MVLGFGDQDSSGGVALLCETTKVNGVDGGERTDTFFHGHHGKFAKHKESRLQSDVFEALLNRELL